MNKALEILKLRAKCYEEKILELQTGFAQTTKELERLKFAEEIVEACMKSAELRAVIFLLAEAIGGEGISK